MRVAQQLGCVGAFLANKVDSQPLSHSPVHTHPLRSWWLGQIFLGLRHTTIRMHYKCDSCNARMKKVGKTSKGKKFKCVSCGETGYMKNMSEQAPGGIDPSAFGL